MSVRIGNKLSSPFPYKRGVRQGCPMSPMLFNFFINSILDSIEPVEIPCLSEGIKGLLFADDLVLLCHSFADLDIKLRAIGEWCNSNGMETNASKCAVMWSKPTVNMNLPPPVYFGEDLIPQVDKYVYHGIEFNDALNL